MKVNMDEQRGYDYQSFPEGKPDRLRMADTDGKGDEGLRLAVKSKKPSSSDRMPSIDSLKEPHPFSSNT
jgi:hypothetical protein